MTCLEQVWNSDRPMHAPACSFILNEMFTLVPDKDLLLSRWVPGPFELSDRCPVVCDPHSYIFLEKHAWASIKLYSTSQTGYHCVTCPFLEWVHVNVSIASSTRLFHK